MTRTQVAPGVLLTCLHTNRFKSNRLQLMFTLPLTPENLANGTLLSAMLRENCAAYPTQALLSRRLEELYDTSLGATQSADGDNLQIGMVLDVLDNTYAADGMDILGGALDVLANCLTAPNVKDGAFDAACLAREQKNAADEIAAQINDKMRYAHLKLREHLFAGEPCARIYPTEADLSAVTPTSLYAFYQWVLATAPVEIIWAGKEQDEALVRFAIDLFANIHRTPLSRMDTKRHDARSEVQIVEETLPVRQGKLCMGFAGAATLCDADYPASVLFRTIYGASPVSKLFMNVREKLSLCYYCHAIPMADKGVLMVSSGVENEKRADAEREILAQLAAVQNGNITEEEFEIAKKYALSSCRTVSDSVSSLIAWWAYRVRLANPPSPEAFAEALSALTIDDIAAYARKLTLDTVYFLAGTLPTDAEEEV